VVGIVVEYEKNIAFKLYPVLVCCFGLHWAALW